MTSWWIETASPTFACLPGRLGRSGLLAPDRVKARLADCGPQEFAKRVGGASAAFVAHARRWLRIETHHGPEAIVAAYRTLLNGDARPDAAIICIP